MKGKQHKLLNKVYNYFKKCYCFLCVIQCLALIRYKIALKIMTSKKYCMIMQDIIVIKIISLFLYLLDLQDEFRAMPKDTDVAIGDETVLNCSPPKGHPPPVVRWKKDGEYLDLTSSNR